MANVGVQIMERVVLLFKVKNDPIKRWSNNNGWGNYKGHA
jgi:hypothetical protein